ncbi:tRNA dimethylallyltransferase [Haloferula sargassicola]|uniref:tRNA dimethylallyltransferase n=1 Tax=Haloferula sargassicola TaxID=490096 RepID=A0ABP9URE7_9BACT
MVNADAFQLYRGLDTLTAAPTAEERAAAPHHLYGVLDPAETCDAMRYREMALPVIADIHARGRLPIVTGGSGLYLKFLTHGPDPLPPGDPALREKLDLRPLDDLVAELRQLDPVEAARTHLANRRYVSRALEICLLSGRRCSELRDRWTARSRDIDGSLVGLVIRRERAELHRRIEIRTRRMLDQGAIDEVRRNELSATLTKAIGVPQIRDFLAEKTDRETCVERIAAATRQYAKRQETWFRRETWLRPLVWSPGAGVPSAAAIEMLKSR